MNEFLKDYHLFGDMCRLNNETYFSEEFDVPDINEFLAALTDASQIKLNNKTLKIYLVNLVRGKEKSMFVQLKWLICLHRSLENINSAALIERIYDCLSRIQLPIVKQNIEHFIGDGIIRPYIHLLAKICLMKMQELDSSRLNQNDKENRNPQENLLFMRYNLMNYLVAEMLPTTLQLYPFLKLYYPFLSKISIFLHQTLTSLFRSVQKDTKKTNIHIDQERLLFLENKIVELDSNNNPSYLDERPNQIGSIMSHFMESDQKDREQPDQWFKVQVQQYR